MVLDQGSEEVLTCRPTPRSIRDTVNQKTQLPTPSPPHPSPLTSHPSPLAPYPLPQLLTPDPNPAPKGLDEVLLRLDEIPEEYRTAVRNGGGGFVNHALFWNSMAPGGSALPAADCEGLIREG